MTIIKSATIVDGTLRAPYKADILLRGKTIAAIGTFLNKKATKTIDALGLYCAPGFIDINTDADHYLGIVLNPAQKDSLVQGITTIIGGHCGSSLAPLLYGSLESIRKWANPSSINIDWRTVGEFLRVLERRPRGVNFGTFVGHSTIRRALIGEDERDLTMGEIAVFQKIIADALRDGAFGLSTGLGYAHSRNVSAEELKKLLVPVARAKGRYATHLRNDREGLWASIEETIRMAEEMNMPTLINHLKPIVGFESAYDESLAALADAKRAGAVRFALSPFDTSVIALYTLLSEWARAGNLEAMLETMKHPDARERILAEWRAKPFKPMIIAGAGGKLEYGHLIGMTLAEFARSAELPEPEALYRLMELTELRATIFLKNVDTERALAALMDTKAFVASNASGLDNDRMMIKHERSYRTFPAFLEAALKRKALTLEAAVQKITAEPAEFLGLTDRGRIAEGARADLTLFSIGTEGDVYVEHALVNGVPALEKGVIIETSAGEVLRAAR